MKKTIKKALLTGSLIFLFLAGSHYFVSRNLYERALEHTRKFGRTKVSSSWQQRLPAVSPNPFVEKEGLKLSLFHSSPAYKQWLRSQSDYLGVREEELHEAVMQTVRNIQKFSKSYVGNPKSIFPFTVFSSRDRLYEHSVLLAELLATATKNKSALYTPLEDLFRKHTMTEKMALRPDIYAPVFHGPNVPDYPAWSHGVVNTIHDKAIIFGFSELLASGKMPEGPVYLTGHEAIHVFDGKRSELGTGLLGISIEKEVLRNPALSKKIFRPLLKLRDAYLSRQAIKNVRTLGVSTPQKRFFESGFPSRLPRYGELRK